MGSEDAGSGVRTRTSGLNVYDATTNLGMSSTTRGAVQGQNWRYQWRGEKKPGYPQRTKVSRRNFNRKEYVMKDHNAVTRDYDLSNLRYMDNTFTRTTKEIGGFVGYNYKMGGAYQEVHFKHAIITLKITQGPDLRRQQKCWPGWSSNILGKDKIICNKSRHHKGRYAEGVLTHRGSM